MRWAVLLLGLLGSSVPAAAEIRSRVLVVGGPDAGLVVGRLCAELAGLGFDAVVGRASSGQLADTDMQHAARAANAIAALGVQGSGESIDVWLLDRATQTLSRGEPVLGEVGSIDPGEMALRAAEQLRARLLEIEARASPAASPVVASPPPAVVAAPAAASAIHWDVSLAAAGALSAGGLAPALQAVVSAEIEVRPRVWLGLHLVLPTAQVVASDANGSAELSTSFLLASASYDLLRGAPISLRLGLDAGAGFMHAVGSAEPGYVGSSQYLFLGLFGAHATVQRRLAFGFFAFFDLGVLVGLPQIDLDLGGQQVATYGVPIGIATLGLGYAR